MGCRGWSSQVGQNAVHFAPHFHPAFVGIPVWVHRQIGIRPQFEPIENDSAGFTHRGLSFHHHRFDTIGRPLDQNRIVTRS